MKCRIQKSPSAQVSSIQNIAAFPPIFRASHEPARFPLGAFHHLLTAKPRTAAGERRHSCTTARHVRTKAPRLHRKKSALSHEHLGKRKGKTCIVWRTTSKPRYSLKKQKNQSQSASLVPDASNESARIPRAVFHHRLHAKKKTAPTAKLRRPYSSTARHVLESQRSPAP